MTMPSELAEIQHGMPHSIELQRGRDGGYYWSIKLYFDDANIPPLDALHSIDLALRDLYVISKGAADA